MNNGELFKERDRLRVELDAGRFVKKDWFDLAHKFQEIGWLNNAAKLRTKARHYEKEFAKENAPRLL